MSRDPDPAGLSHLDAAGRARMVDVSDKGVTLRRARAAATLRLSVEADRLLRAGNLPKGSPVEIARIAAIQAAKQTGQLLPLCHPLRVTGIDVEVRERPGERWQVAVEVRASDRTGVEMEAMTAAAVGALALYDMVKAVDREAVIEEVVLLEKDGGKSGHFVRREESRP
jgi:cyclic pyranopterin phosphate synthase